MRGRLGQVKGEGTTHPQQHRKEIAPFISKTSHTVPVQVETKLVKISSQPVPIFSAVLGWMSWTLVDLVAPTRPGSSVAAWSTDSRDHPWPTDERELLLVS